MYVTEKAEEEKKGVEFSATGLLGNFMSDFKHEDVVGEKETASPLRTVEEITPSKAAIERIKERIEYIFGVKELVEELTDAKSVDQLKQLQQYFVGEEMYSDASDIKAQLENLT